jgi:hypothetical protein
MYEYLLRGDLEGATAMDDDCENCEALRRHEGDAARAHQQGLRGLREMASGLIERIGDARIMRFAIDHIAEKGGTAPGPNGLRCHDLTSRERWSLCKCLASAVLNGRYNRGTELVRWVPKASGKGERPIVLLNHEDRIVMRAIYIILRPLFDPLLDDLCLGFRKKRERLHALGHAEWITLHQQRQHWLLHDIKDAFVHVPVRRLLQVVESMLPCKRLIALLERALPGQTLPGLVQGSALSPLMLNIFLNHFLDRPWRRDFPNVPLIRVADDLLVLCISEEQAHIADEHLRHLLFPTGMTLKASVEEAVHDLSGGEKARWLGWEVRGTEEGLAVSIQRRSWSRLRKHFALAHAKSEAPLRAKHAIEQWLYQHGPCYRWADRGRIVRRVTKLAGEQGFEEIPNREDLTAMWKEGDDAWSKIRSNLSVPETTT